MSSCPIPNDKTACPDCSAEVGENHMTNCDVERCPACGGQALQCLSDDTGKLMCSNTDTEVKEDELIKWDGTWPGKEDCQRLGFWCKWTSKWEIRNGRARWEICDKDDPEARNDLNRLYTEAKWDREKKQFVAREKP